MKRITALGFGACLVLLATQAKASTDPAGLSAWFNANLSILMFAVGVAWKFLPQMKNVSNSAIPWVNALLGILPGIVQLLTPPANAAVSQDVANAAVGAGDVVFRAFVHSAVATAAWEYFGKNLIHGLLRIKAPAQT